MSLDLNDKTVNGNTLTNHGATDDTNPPFGAPNTDNAALVAASTQFLSAATSSTTNITGNITLECWIKFTSLPSAGSSMAFISKWQVATNSSYAFKLNNNAGTYRFQFDHSNDGATIETNSLNITTPTLNTWYHYAMAWTASTSTVEFYINGVSQGTVTGAQTAIFSSTSQFTIGVQETSFYLDGKVDEVRGWSVRRTTGQISGNYNVQLVGNESGLNYYYPFNSLNTLKTFNDSLTTSDSIVKAVTKGFTDNLTTSEVFTNVKGILKTFTDSVKTSEYFKKFINGADVVWTKIVKPAITWTKILKP